MALILSSVKLGSSKDMYPDVNLLKEPVVVAQILGTPSITESSTIIYSTASNELRINGTGFVGAKKVDLYFNPPLYKEVGYEVVSPFPIGKI